MIAMTQNVTGVTGDGSPGVIALMVRFGSKAMKPIIANCRVV